MAINDLVTDELQTGETTLAQVARRLVPNASAAVVNQIVQTLIARNRIVTVAGVPQGLYPHSLLQYRVSDLPAVAGPPPVHGPRPFSDASPFNTPIPTGVKWTDQPLLHTYWWVDSTAAVVTHATTTDPTWRFVMPDYTAPAWNRDRKAQTLLMKAPAGLAAGPDSDHILVLVQPDGSYIETWLTSVDPVMRVVTASAWATGNMITGPGAGTLGGLNDGVRAANFSWAAGLITNADIAFGVIDHALVVAVNGPMLKSGNAYIPPATAGESTGNGPMPCGTRIGIAAGVLIPAGLSALGLMVFNALQKFGAFIGDYTGGSPQFYGQSDVPRSAFDPLVINWNGKPSDLDLIMPLLRIAG